MKQHIKRFIALVLVGLLLLLTACRDKSDGANDKNTLLLNSIPSGEIDEILKNSEGFQKIYESADYILLVDGMTAEVAVQDIKNNMLWRTNPSNRELDSTAQGDGMAMLNSQAIVTYQDHSGNSTIYYTKTDSVDLNQYAFEKIDAGIRVWYDVGENVKVYLYPPRITRKRMNEFLSKLSPEDRETLLYYYNLIDINNFDEATQKIYKMDNPAYEYDSVYAIEGLYNGSGGVLSIPEYIAKDCEELLAKAGYTYEDMEKDYAETGLEIPKPKKAVIRMALEYTINEQGLQVRVPADSISFDESQYHLTEINLLPYFGAAGKEANGYIFVPDGSGALINLNNGKTEFEPYKKQLYGSDKSINYSIMPTSDGANCYLPVFGLKQGNTAFWAVITQGDGSCSVTADISGRYNGYNRVSPEFLMTPNAFVDKEKNKMPDFQRQVIDSDLTVCYYFLYGENSNYSGMARGYREYLLRTGKINSVSVEELKTSLAIQLYGSTLSLKNILGFEYDAVEPLTTYEQAQEILEFFKKNGIENLEAIYLGWGNGSIENSLSDRARVLKELGGKKQFEKLIKYAQKEDIGLIPDINFMYVSEYNNKGFSDSEYASRNILGEVGKVVPYEISVLRASTSKKGSSIVKPTQYLNLADKFKKEYQSYNINNLYLANLGTDLNSDFHRNRLVDRTQAKDYSVKLSEQLKEYNQTFSGANAYMLTNASRLIDVPVESGKAYILDTEIPFYSMVLAGIIPLHGVSLNNQDIEKYTLQMIEAGVYPTIDLMYEENATLRHTYAKFNSVEFEGWRDSAVTVYKSVENILKPLAGVKIFSHQVTEQGVSIVTYENGSSVLVNYREQPVSVQNVTVPARSAIMLPGEDGNKQ